MYSVQISSNGLFTVNCQEIPGPAWRVLASLYRAPAEVDLFAGGLSEQPVPGGLTGPTLNCIKAVQFQRLKQGDRFFFSHRDQATAYIVLN